MSETASHRTFLDELFEAAATPPKLSPEQLFAKQLADGMEQDARNFVQVIGGIEVPLAQYTGRTTQGMWVIKRDENYTGEDLTRIEESRLKRVTLTKKFGAIAVNDQGEIVIVECKDGFSISPSYQRCQGRLAVYGCFNRNNVTTANQARTIREAWKSDLLTVTQVAGARKRSGR